MAEDDAARKARLRKMQGAQTTANGAVTLRLMDALNVNGAVKIGNVSQSLVWPSLGNKLEEAIEAPLFGYLKGRGAAPISNDVRAGIVTSRAKLPHFRHVPLLDERLQLVHQRLMTTAVLRQTHDATVMDMDTSHDFRAGDFVLAQGEVRKPIILQPGKSIQVTMCRSVCHTCCNRRVHSLPKPSSPSHDTEDLPCLFSPLRRCLDTR